MELNNEIKQKIVNIINEANGCNIGTGLQDYLESKVNQVLPTNYVYRMIFNMSGEVKHFIYFKKMLLYTF